MTRNSDAHPPPARWLGWVALLLLAAQTLALLAPHSPRDAGWFAPRDVRLLGRGIPGRLMDTLAPGWRDRLGVPDQAPSGAPSGRHAP